MKLNQEELKNWRTYLIILDEHEEVENPFTSEACMLSPEAVAVYDFIKGCELIINHDMKNQLEPTIDAFHEALSYFREKWTNEYYLLLD